MKKSITLLLIVSYLGMSIINCFAQAPEKMSYQSVIRNSNGLLLGNQAVGIQISILQGAADGDSVYVETHSVTTNVNGLATLEIGGGNVEMGSFENIDWSNGPYFLKTETDPNGGSNYTITGVNQLLSVPYALYAKKVESYSDYGYVTNLWAGDLNGNNPLTIAYTTAEWKGNRKIMLNGYVQLEFSFPQVALTNGINFGTANVDMFLKYNGQTIMPLNFKHFGVSDNAQITLPLNTLIPNSTAGNTMQFSVEGAENTSYTGAISSPGGDYGPYPIDVRVSVVFTWVEL